MRTLILNIDFKYPRLFKVDEFKVECLRLVFGEEDKSKSIQKNISINKSKSRTCETCGFVSETYLLYRKHRATHTNKTCDICHKTFREVNKLVQHKKFVHGTDIQFTSCHLCGKLLKRPDYLITHLKLVHDTKDTSVTCDVCGKQLKNIHTLQIHQRLVHTEDQIHCQLCNKIFKTKYLLNAHLNTTHSTETQVCPVCGKIVKNVNRHLQYMHSDCQKEACDICGKIYPSSFHVKAHKRKVHYMKERKHMCEICGASFKDRQLLNNHYVVHSDERKHKCDECGKAFKLKVILNTHKRIHNANNPYVCNVCGETFKWKQTRDKHFNNCLKGDRD